MNENNHAAKFDTLFNAIFECLVDEEMSHFNPQMESLKTFRERYKKKYYDGFLDYINILLDGNKLIFSTNAFTDEERQEIESRANQIDWAKEEKAIDLESEKFELPTACQAVSESNPFPAMKSTPLLFLFLCYIVPFPSFRNL